MLGTPYENAKKSAEALDPGDQLRLVAELTSRLSVELDPGPRRSILELRGLGKDIWHDVDVAEYLNRERSSWDG